MCWVDVVCFFTLIFQKSPTIVAIFCLGICVPTISREKLKTILGLEENTMIEYKTFKASLQDMSSYRNAKPYVFAVQNTPPKKH